jgi:lipid II:glycine glycyltransferase (peptidoglycan interpeptide bridge formation enzyme)
VTEFAHIHPWRPGRDVLEAGHLEVGRDLVFVDTTARDHELDPDYTRACRKNIRRAQELGVTVREATTDEDLDAFHRIYSATMARREALPAYRYPLDYFERIRSELRSHARFVLAELAGQVVAATLYLCDDEDVYSFLGGSEMAHQHARPTNLLVHETIRWAHETGRLRLVLGGGYRPGDGIERFKAGFSPLRMKLPTFRRVHDQAKYDELLALWVQERGPLVSDYFPPYRADEVTRVVAGAPGHKP